MNARIALARFIERVFPCEPNRIKAERLAKRTAMQQMLDANHAMRANGYETNRINTQLSLAVKRYDAGRYHKVGVAIPW